MTNHFRLGMISVLLCALLIAIPVFAQQQDAAAQALIDAQRNISGTTWLIIGIFLGIIGYVIALASPPSAPASALLGKSSDYVAVYSDTYKEEGKKIQMRSAMVGCLIGVGVEVLLVVVLVAAASSAASVPLY